MFTTLYLKTVIKTKWYVLTEDFKVTINNEEYLVPSGFKTDFATIPRFFWPLAANDDPDMREASVLHDYLYSKECRYNIDRKTADEIFLIAMEELNSSKLKRYIIFLGVRIFGRYYYKT